MFMSKGIETLNDFVAPEGDRKDKLALSNSPLNNGKTNYETIEQKTEDFIRLKALRAEMEALQLDEISFL